MRNVERMKIVLGLSFLLLAAGCASVAKMESGERTLGERLAVTLDGDWNHVNLPGLGPAQVWTMEGLPIDQLLIYSGLKDGEVVHARDGNSKSKDFAFRSAMQPEEIVTMFEGMLTRDGSRFRLVRLEPATFAGKGFRFEYELIRKADNVRLMGVGYGAVSKGELFAMLYSAPRLTFFARNQPRFEQMARTARVKPSP